MSEVCTSFAVVFSPSFRARCLLECCSLFCFGEAGLEWSWRCLGRVSEQHSFRSIIQWGIRRSRRRASRLTLEPNIRQWTTFRRYIDGRFFRSKGGKEKLSLRFGCVSSRIKSKRLPAPSVTHFISLTLPAPVTFTITSFWSAFQSRKTRRRKTNRKFSLFWQEAHANSQKRTNEMVRRELRMLHHGWGLRSHFHGHFHPLSAVFSFQFNRRDQMEIRRKKEERGTSWTLECSLKYSLNEILWPFKLSNGLRNQGLGLMIKTRGLGWRKHWSPGELFYLKYFWPWHWKVRTVPCLMRTLISSLAIKKVHFLTAFRNKTKPYHFAYIFRYFLSFISKTIFLALNASQGAHSSGNDVSTAPFRATV